MRRISADLWIGDESIPPTVAEAEPIDDDDVVLRFGDVRVYLTRQDACDFAVQVIAAANGTAP